MIKKNIWVLNHEAEDIQSVNRIAQNLSKLYLSLSSDLFNVVEINLVDINSLKIVDALFANRIVEFKENTPDHVIIVHPSVTNHLFLSALLSIKTKSQAQFIFHVVGNFIRYGESWFSLNHLLANKKIQFVVASQCYYELLANFISTENLSILPFPINFVSKEVNPRGEGEQREIFNVLYAGRYHEQKNVTCLIRSLNNVSKNTGRRICLNLAVYFDDFNPTTLNTRKILGEQFNEYLKAISGLSASFEVKLLPHQNENELSNLYRSNDVFISFSTFLDEDYGNAIIESLSEGTPCIVSNWGGYKDFCHEFPNDCFGLDIVVEEDKLYLKTEKLPLILEGIAIRKAEHRRKLKEEIKGYIGKEILIPGLLNIFSRKNIFSQFDQSLLGFALELKNQSGKFTSINFKKYYKAFWKTL
jgi:glycosyltransferase involved in cell wall biosynthesis